MNLKPLVMALAVALSTTLTLTTTIMAQDASSNLAKGQAFLKQNATKPGVKTKIGRASCRERV